MDKSVNERRFDRWEVDGEVDLRVIFTRSDDVKEVKARLINAGPGGLYVETKDELPAGALADLDIHLEGANLANTMGLIRWRKPGEGAGIEFFYATEEERDALTAYIDGWLSGRRKVRASHS